MKTPPNIPEKYGLHIKDFITVIPESKIIDTQKINAISNNITATNM